MAREDKHSDTRGKSTNSRGWVMSRRPDRSDNRRDQAPLESVVQEVIEKCEGETHCWEGEGDGLPDDA